METYTTTIDKIKYREDAGDLAYCNCRIRNCYTGSKIYLERVDLNGGRLGGYSEIADSNISGVTIDKGVIKSSSLANVCIGCGADTSIIENSILYNSKLYNTVIMNSILESVDVDISSKIGVDVSLKGDCKFSRDTYFSVGYVINDRYFMTCDCKAIKAIVTDKVKGCLLTVIAYNNGEIECQWLDGLNNYEYNYLDYRDKAFYSGIAIKNIQNLLKGEQNKHKIIGYDNFGNLKFEGVYINYHE